jgi:hypothetical protein
MFRMLYLPGKWYLYKNHDVMPRFVSQPNANPSTAVRVTVSHLNIQAIAVLKNNPFTALLSLVFIRDGGLSRMRSWCGPDQRR